MITFDVSSDIDRAISEVGEFWRNQVPYATSRALTDTAFEVRKYITDITYTKAFNVKNKVFAGRQWRVTQKATKRQLEAIIDSIRDDGYFERFMWHADGGRRVGRNGHRIAVPAEPDKMRSPTGRVRAGLKPRALKGQPGIFEIKKGGKTLILKRGRGKGKPAKLLYTITMSTKIDKRFMFYEDATRVAIDRFPHLWSAAMTTAIHKSRFYATP